MHKDHLLSSAGAATYRQSFLDRCQRAMHQERSVHRHNMVTKFRKGVDGATPALFSDDMDVDMDEEDSDALPPSSPPMQEFEREGEEREEDNEMTRRMIIAEYQRLKRVYELKGELEIGWIEPDQLAWLEQQQAQAQAQANGFQADEEGEEQVDPYWDADDEELEQLWLQSQQQPPPPQQDVYMMDDDDFTDPELDEALARLPC